jgi:alanine racemase
VPGLPDVRPTRAAIDLAALCENAELIRRASGGAAVCAIVKADAYGHGAQEVARALELSRACASLGVSLVEEGVALRDAGVTLPILVMGPAQAGGHAELVARDLTPVVSDASDLEALAALGRGRHQPIRIHLKVDTGMHRLGIPVSAVGSVVEGLLAAGGLALAGICTHFASADLPDLAAAIATTGEQLAQFDRALAAARAAGAAPGLVHAANSAGTFRFPEARFDMVRPGIALYGNGAVVPPAALGRLRQVMCLESAVAQIRDVGVGEAVSYGGVWRAERASRIAVVPVGYADGFPRSLTGKADALVRGRRCPVVGVISMDMSLVDVTSLSHDARVGDAVVLLGAQGDDSISTAEMAERAGLTEYEVTCGISRRVPRIYR